MRECVASPWMLSLYVGLVVKEGNGIVMGGDYALSTNEMKKLSETSRLPLTDANALVTDSADLKIK